LLGEKLFPSNKAGKRWSEKKKFGQADAQHGNVSLGTRGVRGGGKKTDNVKSRARIKKWKLSKHKKPKGVGMGGKKKKKGLSRTRCKCSREERYKTAKIDNRSRKHSRVPRPEKNKTQIGEKRSLRNGRSDHLKTG